MPPKRSRRQLLQQRQMRQKQQPQALPISEINQEYLQKYQNARQQLFRQQRMVGQQQQQNLKNLVFNQIIWNRTHKSPFDTQLWRTYLKQQDILNSQFQYLNAMSSLFMFIGQTIFQNGAKRFFPQKYQQNSWRRRRSPNQNIRKQHQRLIINVMFLLQRIALQRNIALPKSLQFFNVFFFGDKKYSNNSYSSLNTVKPAIFNAQQVSQWLDKIFRQWDWLQPRTRQIILSKTYKEFIQKVQKYRKDLQQNQLQDRLLKKIQKRLGKILVIPQKSLAQKEQQQRIVLQKLQQQKKKIQKQKKQKKQLQKQQQLERRVKQIMQVRSQQMLDQNQQRQQQMRDQKQEQKKKSIFSQLQQKKDKPKNIIRKQVLQPKSLKSFPKMGRRQIQRFLPNIWQIRQQVQKRRAQIRQQYINRQSQNFNYIRQWQRRLQNTQNLYQKMQQFQQTHAMSQQNNANLHFVGLQNITNYFLQNLKDRQNRQFINAMGYFQNGIPKNYSRNYKGQQNHLSQPLKYWRALFTGNIHVNSILKQNSVAYLLARRNYSIFAQKNNDFAFTFVQPDKQPRYATNTLQTVQQLNKLNRFLQQGKNDLFQLMLQPFPKISKWFIKQIKIWGVYQVCSHLQKIRQAQKLLRRSHSVYPRVQKTFLKVLIGTFLWPFYGFQFVKQNQWLKIFQQCGDLLSMQWSSNARNPRLRGSSQAQNSFPRLSHYLTIPPIIAKDNSSVQILSIPLVPGIKAKKFLQRSQPDQYIDWISCIYYNQFIWLTNAVCGYIISKMWKQLIFFNIVPVDNLSFHSTTLDQTHMSTTFKASTSVDHIFLPRAWNNDFSLYSVLSSLRTVIDTSNQQLKKWQGIKFVMFQYYIYASSQQITSWPSIYKTWINQKSKQFQGKSLVQQYKTLLQAQFMQQAQGQFQISLPIQTLNLIGTSLTFNDFVQQQSWFSIMFNTIPPLIQIDPIIFFQKIFLWIDILRNGSRSVQPLQRKWAQNWRHYTNQGHKLRYQKFQKFHLKFQNQTCWQIVQKWFILYGIRDFPIQVKNFDSIIQLSNWCKFAGVSIFVQGYASWNYHNNQRDWAVYLSPCHIDIVSSKIFKPKKKANQHIIITYRSICQSQQLPQVQYFPNQKYLNWRIGYHLPIQQDYNDKDVWDFRRNSVCIDFQCLSVKLQNQIPYMVCLTGYPFTVSVCQTITFSQGSIYHRYAYGRNNVLKQNFTALQPQIRNNGQCIDNFIQWLARNVHKWNYSPLTIYSFNGFRYQLVFLYAKLVKRFGRVDSLGQPRQSRGFSILQGAIRFVDGCKLVPGTSLKKACKNFNTIIKKQEFQIAIIDNWQLVQQNWKQIQKYCIQDCACTFLLIQKIYLNIQSLYQKQRSIIQLKRRTTAPSLAWDFWGQQFFKKSLANLYSMKGQKYTGTIQNLNLQPIPVYKLQRANYFGGIVQVYQHIVKQNIYPLDVNSMYPFQMTKPLPWHYMGQIQQLEPSLLQQQSDIYFYHISVFQFPREWLFNFIPVRGKTRNQYYHGYTDWNMRANICVWGHTVKFLRKIGGICQIFKGWRYSNGSQTSLKRFSQIIYQKRRKAKAQKNDSLSNVLKLLMNSLTGRLSMKQRQSGYTTIFRGNRQDVDFQVGQQHQCQISQFKTLIGVDKLPQPGRLVRLTSYITSASRLKLAQISKIVGQKNFFYCDTDSLYVNKQGWINLGKPNQQALQLGDLKLQLQKQQQIIRGYFFSRKFYLLKNNKGKWKKRVKGIPQKYMSDQYCQKVCQRLQQTQVKLQNAYFGQQIPLLDQWGNRLAIPIQVWRRDYKTGTVIIKNMDKRINIQMDRLIQKSRRVGLNLARFISIPQMQSQQN